VTAAVAPDKAMTPTNFLGYGPGELEQYFVALGEKRFRAHQVLKWIYHHRVADFEAMTDLGAGLRQRLSEAACIEPPRVLRQAESGDGTVKWLMGLAGGNAVETVFIPEPGRGTLCISSQVGCSLNCTFCATGAQGFNRNLSTAEIIGQVWQAAQRLGHERNGRRRITNVVMMGMGEPLLNLDAVEPVLRLLRDDLGFGLASRRVTVSTAGLVPGIDRLRETVDVALAVSLHAPEDLLRSSIVPLNRKYPIDSIMAACQRFLQGRHKRSVTFEYTLLDGVNDQPEHARALGRLLSRLPSKLNLIPFNPFPGTNYRCPPPQRIEQFQQIVRRYGLITTLRKTRGDDIDAACGQLAGDFRDRTRRRRELRAGAAGAAP